MCFLADAETSKTKEPELRFGQDLEKALSEFNTVIEKESIGSWRVSTYYSPHAGQTHYFNGSYAMELYVNTSGDIYTTASGYKLSDSDAGKVVACPPPYALGTKFWTEEHGVLTCEDRGGAIKGKRLDLYQGVGQAGHDRIGQGSGWYDVFLLDS